MDPAISALIKGAKRGRVFSGCFHFGTLLWFRRKKDKVHLYPPSRLLASFSQMPNLELIASKAEFSFSVVAAAAVHSST